MAKKKTTDKFADKIDNCLIGVDISQGSDFTASYNVDETIDNKPIGIVDNCYKLNIRSIPNTKAAIVAIVDTLTEFTIDEAKSNDEWYYVSNGDVSGYCMKQYITIKK